MLGLTADSALLHLFDVDIASAGSNRESGYGLLEKSPDTIITELTRSTRPDT